MAKNKKRTPLLLLLCFSNVLGFTPSKSALIRVPTLPQSSKRTLPLSLPQNSPGIVAAASKEAEEEEIPAGEATVTQLIFNLVKSILGGGVLSLPAGIAAFGNAPSAVIPGIGLIAGIGCLSGYCFALIGRCCAITNTSSYRDAWSATVGESTSWMPALAVTFLTLCYILAYSMILGDTFVSLLATAGITASKTSVTLAMTSTVLFPLCLLKNLSALAPFSLVGSLGMIYTAAAMVIRYFGNAYTSLGRFGADCVPALRPIFGSVGARGVMTPSAAILVGMLSSSYGAHFNAPKFYNELKDRTLPRYYKVVSTSFAISVAIFALVAAIGFLTFGSASNGLILNNYSNNDSLMSLSRIAVAVSLVFSYPLVFVGAREGCSDLLKLKKSTNTQNILTVSLLSVVTFLALKIPDVAFVLSLGGATVGNALIYIFPALMFRGAIQRKEDATRWQKQEVKFSLGTAIIGFIMGVVGAKMAFHP